MAHLGRWLADHLPRDLPLTIAGDGAERAASALLAQDDFEAPVHLAAPEGRVSASPGSVARLGLARFLIDGPDDPEALDPVYIRPAVGV